ncbi:RNA recognition motif protein, partial [Gregarina niphandrodes]
FETGRPRGFGFVEFQHAADAQEALRALNDTDLDGSRISISVAQHGRKTPSLMRARSSGGGYGRSGRRHYRKGDPYSAPDRYDRSPPRSRRYERSYDNSRGYSSGGRDYRDGGRDGARDGGRDGGRDYRDGGRDYRDGSYDDRRRY